jgi:hypothetical protein
MTIHTKIVLLANLAIKKANPVFTKTQLKIVASIYDHLRKKSYISYSDLDDIIESHSEAASAVDAASHLLEQLPLRGLTSRPSDHRVPQIRDHNDVKHFLKEVESRNARGCVYVAWRKKPFEFLYIGKAGADDSGKIKRLTDPKHVDLSHALKTAQYLSLIHTKKTSANTLLKLEACLLELYFFLRKEGFIRGRRGTYLPIHNTQHPRTRLHQGDAFTEIRRIIKNLHLAADAIMKKEYGPKSKKHLPDKDIFNSTASPLTKKEDSSFKPLNNSTENHQSVTVNPPLLGQPVKTSRFYKTYKSVASSN